MLPADEPHLPLVNRGSRVAKLQEQRAAVHSSTVAALLQQCCRHSICLESKLHCAITAEQMARRPMLRSSEPYTITVTWSRASLDTPCRSQRGSWGKTVTALTHRLSLLPILSP